MGYHWNWNNGWDDDYIDDGECYDPTVGDLIDYYSVKLPGKYAPEYMVSYVATDTGYSGIFKCNEHELFDDSCTPSIDGYSIAWSKHGIEINSNTLEERCEIGKHFVCINGFECEKTTDNGFEAKHEEYIQEYKSIVENVKSEAAKAGTDPYFIVFGAFDEAEVFDSSYNFEQLRKEVFYGGESKEAEFGEYKTEDGKVIVVYYYTYTEGMVCTEYTDENGRDILCMNEYVLIRFNDENGKPVVRINGNELSEYDEGDRHIVRINGYELVTYEENGETVGFINGVKCRNIKPVEPEVNDVVDDNADDFDEVRADGELVATGKCKNVKAVEPEVNNIKDDKADDFDEIAEYDEGDRHFVRMDDYETDYEIDNTLNEWELPEIIDVDE